MKIMIDTPKDLPLYKEKYLVQHLLSINVTIPIQDAISKFTRRCHKNLTTICCSEILNERDVA